MSFKIRIQGEVIELGQQYKKPMQYFSNAQAIGFGNSGQPIDISTMTKDDFLTIKKACEVVNFNFPDVPQVKTNNLEEVIHPGLAQLLSNKSNEQINNLYKGASFLNMSNLCRAICAVVACNIYYPHSLQAYIAKKKELNINSEPTSDFSTRLRDQYPFMN